MKRTLVLLTLALVMIACNLPLPPFQGENVQPSRTAPPDYSATMVARGTIPPTANAGDYPATPEGVVYAFMKDFQKSPENLNVYLSKSRLSQLPPEGAASLLKLNEALEGFVVQSGTTRMKQAVARVEVGLKSGKKETRRVFTLVQEDGRWVINGIEIFD